MPTSQRQPEPSPLIEVNGWGIYAHPLFIDQLEALTAEVEQLRAKAPAGYREKKKTKLLAAIHKMAFEVIPADPASRIFIQGSTLGKSYRHWHRGKFFDGRYRLFFRYATAARAIVLAWVND
jgi:toxin YhaV